MVPWGTKGGETAAEVMLCSCSCARLRVHYCEHCPVAWLAAVGSVADWPWGKAAYVMCCLCPRPSMFSRCCLRALRKYRTYSSAPQINVTGEFVCFCALVRCPRSELILSPEAAPLLTCRRCTNVNLTSVPSPSSTQEQRERHDLLTLCNCPH